MLAVIALQNWTASGQAAWDAAAGPKLAAELDATAAPISMSGQAEFDVKLRASGGRLAVSPSLTTTTGVAIEVRNEKNQLVAPLEPMPGSPPPGPRKDSQLSPVPASEPYVAKVREPAKWLFPGPGAYRVRAIVLLVNYNESNWNEPGPPARIKAESPWISVVVTK